ncbi:MAG: DUF2809 domain-containing protein [Lachnospiraceae bacterium]|nr:DUF2809 domain-containing protein [Lachnospiraceae bacterium]MDE7028922.1 DUF2809 domain-containing protein [Lachnospiraceae bacterium]
MESSQYFHLVELLEVGENRLLRTLSGTSFDWKAILCYAVGCALLSVKSMVGHLRTRGGELSKE